MYYFYVARSDLERLRGAGNKIILIGSDFGYGNFGDILQHCNVVGKIKEFSDLVVVSVFSTNAIGFRDFPVWAKNNYNSDIILYASDYPLIFDGFSPDLVFLDRIDFVSAVYMYGGGFLNKFWGDFVLGVTEFILSKAPGVKYFVSGQQVTYPFHERVIEHIKKNKPEFFGVRDELSLKLLSSVGFNAAFSFDDATESLTDLVGRGLFSKGNGLIIHMNSSGYVSSAADFSSIIYDMDLLKRFSFSIGECTILQAFRDVRSEVNDTIETIKKLDNKFPFYDCRLIDLSAMAYPSFSNGLSRPIVANISYSSSYHTALLLQLAGIPCWIRGCNDFYSQKASGLQVDQTFAEFINDPRVADHSLNLERRACWNSFFGNYISSIGGSSVTIDFSFLEPDKSPWPFYYKGAVIGGGQGDIASKKESLSDDEYEIYILNKRIEALSSQITEIGDELNARSRVIDELLLFFLRALRRALSIWKIYFRGRLKKLFRLNGRNS